MFHCSSLPFCLEESTKNDCFCQLLQTSGELNYWTVQIGGQDAPCYVRAFNNNTRIDAVWITMLCTYIICINVNNNVNRMQWLSGVACFLMGGCGRRSVGWHHFTRFLQHKFYVLGWIMCSEPFPDTNSEMENQCLFQHHALVWTQTPLFVPKKEGPPLFFCYASVRGKEIPPLWLGACCAVKTV